MSGDYGLCWSPGTSRIPHGDGWLVHTPDGEFLELEPEPGREHVLRRLLTDPPTNAEADAETRELLAALGEHGLVRAATPPRQARVGLTGQGPLRAAVARLLADDGAQVVPLADTQTRQLREVDLLVACAEQLPDRLWCELDERCAELGLPWHRAHGEGRRYFVGPLTDGPTTARYGDLRLRRLAASQNPEELHALWAWLDAGNEPTPHHDPAGATLAAALLVADIRAWREGRTPPGRNVQFGVDTEDGEVRRHPVLPIPADLMREAP
ncbi:hypothetical protein RIF23_10130 [Lipingzhangella sp. LS1_29]|uniref:Uncharacterized protein n=1 Tax=Lipingzhangella rawalii TaxID=2055835 RepID=A0ABU2H5R6_9ACTN|nr:hypothetical protein [Lipingzhangella rawalii]MDS1270656.1 hypothetical protein [Lipingzhangella rawalii]